MDKATLISVGLVVGGFVLGVLANMMRARAKRKLQEGVDAVDRARATPDPKDDKAAEEQFEKNKREAERLLDLADSVEKITLKKG